MNHPLERSRKQQISLLISQVSLCITRHIDDTIKEKKKSITSKLLHLHDLFSDALI